MLVEWKKEYELGHAGIDAQHRQLFDLTNQMAAARTADELKPLLMVLFKHTREHFELEEALMRDAGFPGLADHTEYHNKLLSRLTDLSLKLGSGQPDPVAISQLMLDWALRHTQFDDADAAAYIAKN